MPRKRHGSAINESMIAEAAWKELQRAHADWTIDDLLIHPYAALQLCTRVRVNLGLNAKTYADPFILKSLLNLRKRGGCK